MKPNKLSLLIFIITGLLLSITILIDCSKKTFSRKKEFQENMYPQLRNIAFNVKPKKLGLNLKNDNDLYGIIMDWWIEKGIVTVVSFKTGDASVYLSSGTILIGGGTHENIHQFSIDFIHTGDKYVTQAMKTTNRNLCTKNTVVFYFLTKSGFRYLKEDVKNFENEDSALLELFEAGNKIISGYRKYSEQMNDK